eukprot:TRINITY_DN2872_c0_g1_i3.p1 TRINITY_DN2872_c0_g1~~TRINITY_DN2872_c0_g1_i3.p1  ORF type:complete len:400 (+),score=78.79 TRINITY_DN2872_c0_g1_i3:21-1220(+)
MQAETKSLHQSASSVRPKKDLPPLPNNRVSSSLKLILNSEVDDKDSSSSNQNRSSKTITVPYFQNDTQHSLANSSFTSLSPPKELFGQSGQTPPPLPPVLPPVLRKFTESTLRNITFATNVQPSLPTISPLPPPTHNGQIKPLPPVPSPSPRQIGACPGVQSPALPAITSIPLTSVGTVEGGHMGEIQPLISLQKHGSSLPTLQQLHEQSLQPSLPSKPLAFQMSINTQILPFENNPVSFPNLLTPPPVPLRKSVEREDRIVQPPNEETKELKVGGPLRPDICLDDEPLPVLNVSTITPRIHIALEILKTERSYVKSLRLVINTFLKPLRENPDGIISLESLNVLFSNIERVLDVNEMLLDFLEKRLSEWTDSFQELGDIFVKIVTSLINLVRSLTYNN